MSPPVAFYTAAQAAHLLGISRSRLSQIAKARGIRPARTIGNVYQYAPAQVRLLTPASPGAPKGNRNAARNKA